MVRYGRLAASNGAPITSRRVRVSKTGYLYRDEYLAFALPETRCHDTIGFSWERRVVSFPGPSPTYLGRHRYFVPHIKHHFKVAKCSQSN